MGIVKVSGNVVRVPTYDGELQVKLQTVLLNRTVKSIIGLTIPDP